MQYLLEVNSVDIIAVDFSYDILKVTENKISYIFRDHAQTINKPTHISGLLIDQVYIKKNLIKKFFIKVIVKNIYFSDRDSLRIAIEKNAIDFHICP